MARKYKQEFQVILTVKVEDETTEAQLKRDLKDKAASVSDMKIEVGEVVKTFPINSSTSPAPTTEPENKQASEKSAEPEPAAPKQETEPATSSEAAASAV